MTIIDLIDDLNERLDKTLKLTAVTEFEQGVSNLAITIKGYLERTREKVLSDN